MPLWREGDEEISDVNRGSAQPPSDGHIIYIRWSVVPIHTRSNSLGRLVLKPLATFSMLTSETLRVPRSMPL
jgi:hypothetical protein